MRRYFLVAAVLVLATTWYKPASAQGMGGNTKDPNAEIESARRKQKQSLKYYGKSSATAGSRRGSGADLSGRLDFAGRPVSGYPTVRGDLKSTRVSRGGANGVAAARRRGRR